MLYNGRATDNLKVRPPCSFCTANHVTESLAVVDGATYGYGWTYMCEDHFVDVGIGLGKGVGQVLLCGDYMDNRLRVEFKLVDDAQV